MDFTPVAVLLICILSLWHHFCLIEFIAYWYYHGFKAQEAQLLLGSGLAILVIVVLKMGKV